MLVYLTMSSKHIYRVQTKKKSTTKIVISQKPLNILLQNSACLFDTYFSKVRLNLIKFEWRAPKRCHPEVKQCYFHFNRQLLTAISNKLTTKTTVLGLGLNDDDKMRITTLREFGMSYRNIIVRFPDKNCKIYTVQNICWRVDERGSLSFAQTQLFWLLMCGLV